MKASIVFSPNPNIISSMRTHLTLIQLSIGVKVVRFVRVRAYKRYR